jgi:geranylgeranyl diphosphate synthase type II
MAILAGDALLNKAFEVMSSEGMRLAEQGELKSENVVKIISELSKLSGSEGMIGGQVVDLESEGKSVGEEILRHTYACKTGALLKSPVYIATECARGAVTGAAESIDNDEKALLRYAELIGLAFQIKDDILDVEGDSALLGKETGSDDKENKTTMVTIFGIEKCKKMLAEMTDEAVEIAGSFGDKGAFLKWLALFLLERNY